LPSLLFFAWNPGLVRGQTRVPKRSYVLAIILTVLSVLYFIGGWRYGVKYEGIEYTQNVCFVNVFWVGVLAAEFVLAGARPSFQRNLTVHWLFFAWLGWYAFPWLGELS